MRRLYVVTFMVRRDKGYDFTVSARSYAFLGFSEEEAIGDGFVKSEKTFPADDGWYDRQINASVVDDDLIRSAHSELTKEKPESDKTTQEGDQCN